LRRQSKAVRLTSPSPFSATGACFISVQVKATAAGLFTNTTGPISANEGGPGAASNTPRLTVTATPLVVGATVRKALGDALIPLNGTTSLSFNITNPNLTTELVSIALLDALPSGLVVADPNGLTGSCVVDDGAAVIADPGSTSINLFGLNLPGSTLG